MSLILEALRKSEAERRRGQVPDLHADASPGALRVRDGPPAGLWLVLALATAVVLAMAFWLARSVLSVPPRAADVPVAATGPARVVSVDTSGDAGLRANPLSVVGPPTMPDDRAGAGAIPVLMPVPDREDRARMPAAPAAVATPTPTPTPTPSTPSARAPATTRSAAAAAPAVSAAPAPAIAAPERVAAIAEPAKVAAAVASTSEPDALTAAAPGSAPLRLSDLAVAERRQLPALKMSMHMWAPTQRFAIIDGARVSEGDRIGDAVVEEITADGVVLAWQGRRLQIPTR